MDKRAIKQSARNIIEEAVNLQSLISSHSYHDNQATNRMCSIQRQARSILAGLEQDDGATVLDVLTGLRERMETAGEDSDIEISIEELRTIMTTMDLTMAAARNYIIPRLRKQEQEKRDGLAQPAA